MATPADDLMGFWIDAWMRVTLQAWFGMYGPGVMKQTPEVE